MENYNIRYGASFELTVTTDDPTANTATLVIGKPGTAPVITQPASFVDGEATITLAPGQTEIPLGEYNYQINIDYLTGELDKFPEDGCFSPELPTFTILEALDEQEVS